MCLALPALVVSLHADGTATVSIGGLKKSVSLALVEGVAPGDYVVIHTGFALSKLDRAAADKTLALLRDTPFGTAAESES